MILFEMRALRDRLGRLEKGPREVFGGELEGDAPQICITALAVFVSMSQQIKKAKLLPMSDDDINSNI